jgi:leucyl/phenylalanyl-tRNA--protein transferase
MKENQFKLLDTQYINEHLKQFGAKEIPNEEYEMLLAEALES